MWKPANVLPILQNRKDVGGVDTPSRLWLLPLGYSDQLGTSRPTAALEEAFSWKQALRVCSEQGEVSICLPADRW